MRRLMGGRPRLGGSSRSTIEQLVAYPTFGAMGLDAEQLLREIPAGAGRGADYPRLVRTIMQRYAEANGKARWGDKTPRYVNHMPMLRRMFPDARFLHVIQDGRHVVASINGINGRPAVQAAAFWRRHVRRGHRDGRRLGAKAYMELRLEDLIAEPEGQMRRVCAFLGEEYSSAVLDHGRQFEGQPVASRHVEATQPLHADRPDWRAGLTEREAREVEAICAPVLSANGYAATAVGPASRARAWTDVAVDAARRAPAVAAGIDRVLPDGYDAVVRD